MHQQVHIFIQDLAFIMLMAGVATLVCRLIKQPIVLGYISAGIIIGPHTPPFSLIANENTIKTLAELGVIFLMFSVGLEFNLRKLSRVGLVAFIAAMFEILLMLVIGYKLGRIFGWSQLNAIFLGAILSISSTTIIVKVLSDLKLIKEPFAHLIFGILIFEDIFGILILALLSSFAMHGGLPLHEFMLTAIKLLAFLVIALLIGVVTIPKFISYIATFKSNELLLISVLGLCFGFCLLVIKLDYSIALGAFIIGAIIAESKEFLKISHLIEPIRDMFSAIFFVSVGLLFDFGLLKTYLLPIIIITIAVIVGKVFSSSLGVLVTGRDAKTAMRTGLGLAQIGEFSFIIAALGLTLGVTDAFLFSIAVSVSIITTLLTPYLIRYSDQITKSVTKIIPKKVSSTFSIYVAWIKNLQPSEEQVVFNTTLKYIVVNVIVNLFIVIAIFLTSAFIAKTDVGTLLTRITNIHIQKTLIWALALLLSLPFLIAVYRKIKSLSMILAEVSVKSSVQSKFNSSVRKIISELIPLISLLCIMFFIFILSISILPPTEWLILVLVIAAILITILWPVFIKLQSRLQASLMQSLADNTLERKKTSKKQKK